MMSAEAIKRYVIRKRGDQHCVFDADESGESQGKPLGCHDSEQAAMDQMQAIGASAGRKDALKDCVSDKIRHLMASGYPQQQAIAIAYSECGEGRRAAAFDALDKALQDRWLTAFSAAYLNASDIDEAEKAAWSAVGTSPDKAQKALRCKNCSTRVKALEQSGRIGGYLVVWGDPSRKDLQGEFFTSDTDLALDWYPRRPVLYHHGLDGTLQIKMIGQLDTFQIGDVGLWVEGQLDMRDKYVQAIYRLAQEGKLGWSSGSLPHMVQVERSGKIVRWPIVEGSMTPTPAEPRDTDVISRKHYCDAQAVSQAYKSAGLNVPDLSIPDDAREGAAAKGLAGGGEVGASSSNRTLSTPMEGKTMPEQEVLTKDAAAQLVADMLKQAREAEKTEREQADLKAKAARVDALETENAALKAQKPPEDPARRLPGHTDEADHEVFNDPSVRREPAQKLIPIITVGSKYDSLSAVDMAYGKMIVEGLVKDGKPHPISAEYRRALAEKTWREGFRPVKADGSMYKHDELAVKVDELNHSDLASYGDEWVPTLWESELWRKARVDNVILPLFRSLEMPSNPFELPIEGTDPTVYYVPETSDEAHLLISGAGNPMPDSMVGSGKVTLTAKKLAIRVGFSAELVEDSIIPILPMYREQGIRAMMDAIDYTLLNGDTEAGATGNINADDQAAVGTEKYMAFNGLRKLPLVTTTANKLDAAGAPTASLLRQIRFLMSPKYALRTADCVYIVDGGTYGKLLETNEIITLDKYGQAASILTGEVGKIYGVPVMASAEMSLTEADGKLSYDTPANNTKGQAVCVYRPGWMVGYRRRVAASMTYIPYFDAYQMVATLRIAFINFDSEVSSCLYDITV